MSGLDLRALREAAEAATSGPWSIDGPWWHEDDELGGYDATDMVTAGDERVAVAVTASRDLNRTPDKRNEDMRFIAAANPSAVLALLDRLEAAEGAVERARKVIEDRHAGDFAPILPKLAAALDGTR